MMRRTRDGHEQGTRKRKAHDEGDEALHILVVDNLAQACRIAKQQSCKDRNE
jgi:hypothetical protein